MSFTDMNSTGVFACCLHFAVSQLGTRKQQGAVELFHHLYFAALSLIGWQGPLGFHDVNKTIEDGDIAP